MSELTKLQAEQAREQYEKKLRALAPLPEFEAKLLDAFALFGFECERANPMLTTSEIMIKFASHFDLATVGDPGGRVLAFSKREDVRGLVSAFGVKLREPMWTAEERFEMAEKFRKQHRTFDTATAGYEAQQRASAARRKAIDDRVNARFATSKDDDPLRE